MLGRLAKAVVAAVFAATVAPAVPAVAQDGTWTVSPGGAFHAEASEAVISVQETGTQLLCSSFSADGTAKSGAGLANPLIAFPASPGVQFNNCQGPLGLTFEVQHVGTWNLVCDSYDGDVVTCRIVDIVIDLVAPGCTAQITGYLDVTYTNSTGIWRILPNYTLTVSFVDPNANCFGLIEQGQHVAVAAEFATPGFTITSPAPVTALDDTWTIAPGGDFFGLSADAPVFAVAETGVNVVCSSAEVVGTTASGTGLTNPLAVLPDPGTTVADCQSIFRPYDIEQVGDWYLHGDTYDGVDVVTGRITGVELDVNGVGCAATIAGDLDITYTNSTDRLTVLPNPTLEFTFVDPVNDCLGLFQQGEHLSLDVAFEITPDLTITSP